HAPRHAARRAGRLRSAGRVGGNQYQLAHDPAHAVYCGYRPALGAGATLAAMARHHRPAGAIAVDLDSARRSPSHRPGPAAWRGDLDLAHAPALPTGAGQPVVACHRAWLLSVQRLAVLVVGAAHTATQDARGPVGDSA